MTFIVVPAIDLKDGNCVRLEQGMMEKDTVFSDNPSAQAREWECQGAERLHIVDLNGAFAGTPKNRAAIEAIVSSVSIPVQVGGGIRDMDTIRAYIDMGVNWIILGTVAQKNPALVQMACKKYPGRIIVGIDAKNGMVAINGWAEVTNERAVDLARKFAGYGVSAIIYTDIARDGMLSGPNIEATRDLAIGIDVPVFASGGVSTLSDIDALIVIKSSGVAGVITGRAVYTGTIKLAEAVELTKRKREVQPC